jgi:hypothetical protein
VSKTKLAAMSATQVADVLAEKHFASNAYEVLREVRNGTGYAQRTRSADMLVVSTWPSRGVWFGGVEIKVSRGDWKRELADPSKSDEIQRFCSYWWIAAPEGIVQLDELPETWGLIEVTPTTAKVRKAAPKLEAQPPTAVFVASVLRNAADANEKAHQRGRHAALVEASERYSPHVVRGLQSELDLAQRASKRAEEALESLRASVRAFEDATGTNIGGYRQYGELEAGASYMAMRRAVMALDGCNLTSFAALLRSTAQAVESADNQVRAARAEGKASE